MLNRFALLTACCGGVLALAPGALASFEPVTREQIVAGGVLARPVFVTHAPGDHSRIFIVEQRSGSTGRVRAFDLGTNSFLDTAANPFLAVPGVTTFNEQGLLGLAFHPNYADNGYFFVNFTNSSGTVIRRYTVSENNPNLADPNSAKTILTFAQPATNHNGGWLAFGPDGYLYIATGDGGSGFDPWNNAQNLGSYHGKMLRIDVDVENDSTAYQIPPDNPFLGQPARAEIWAYGLRNPWRNSFDRDYGDLFIADVGQHQREEINFQHVDSEGGENYGWCCFEGNLTVTSNTCPAVNPNNPATCPSANDVQFPFHDYSISGFGNPRCAIIGGYVYRGCAIPSMRGTYFFADYCPGHILSLEYDRDHVPAGGPGGMSNLTDHSSTLGAGLSQITSFGQDADGEIYFTTLTSGVHKIVPVDPTVKPADLNCDGVVNVFDLLDLLAQWGDCPGCKADLTGDGFVNVFDLLELLAQWG